MAFTLQPFVLFTSFNFSMACLEALYHFLLVAVAYSHSNRRNITAAGSFWHPWTGEKKVAKLWILMTHLLLLIFFIKTFCCLGIFELNTMPKEPFKCSGYNSGFFFLEKYILLITSQSMTYGYYSLETLMLCKLIVSPVFGLDLGLRVSATVDQHPGRIESTSVKS